MTVLHDDPLCPHGVPNFQVCQACAAELADPGSSEKAARPRPQGPEAARQARRHLDAVWPSATVAEDVDVALGKILNPPQEDTPTPPIQREGE